MYSYMKPFEEMGGGACFLSSEMGRTHCEGQAEAPQGFQWMNHSCPEQFLVFVWCPKQHMLRISAECKLKHPGRMFRMFVDPESKHIQTYPSISKHIQTYPSHAKLWRMRRWPWSPQWVPCSTAAPMSSPGRSGTKTAGEAANHSIQSEFWFFSEDDNMIMR